MVGDYIPPQWTCTTSLITMHGTLKKGRNSPGGDSGYIITLDLTFIIFLINDYMIIICDKDKNEFFLIIYVIGNYKCTNFGK